MEHLRGAALPAAGEEPTDGDLLERFAACRDEAAFGELVRRHGAMVHGVGRRVLDNAEDVEDAFQATFMVLARKAESIRKRESVASWLFGVALRVARRARTSLIRRRTHERRAAVSVNAAAPTSDETWQDLRPVLDDAVDCLPEKYRVLVVLCYLEGKTYDEAARLLQLAKGTVSTRLTQARTMLRRQLKRRGVAVSVALLAMVLEENAAPAEVPVHLPPRTVEGACNATRNGGAISPRISRLAEIVLRDRAGLKPTTVAALALALLIGCGGLLLYRWLGPSRGKGEDDGRVWVWQEKDYRLPDHQSMSWGLTFSPDGQTLVSQGSDPLVRLWSVATGQSKAVLKTQNAGMHMFVGFTPDGSELVTVDETDVILWKATGEKISSFPGTWVTKLAQDGKSLASIRANGTVIMFDVAGRKVRAIGERLLPMAKRLAFTNDSAVLAVGTEDGAVILCDPATLQERRRLPGNGLPVLDLAFSPDGTALAAIYGREQPPAQEGEAVRATPREVQIWQIATEQSRPVGSRDAASVRFAPDGKTLAAMGLNGAIDLFDSATGERRRRVTGPLLTSRVIRLVFSPDGKSILAPAAAGTAVLRDTNTGRVVSTFKAHKGTVVDAAFSADGRTVATGSLVPNGMTDVQVWDRAP